MKIPLFLLIFLVPIASFSQTQDAAPLGRGIMTRGSDKVIRLVCLERDSKELCIKAQFQFAHYSDIELDKDYLGNPISRLKPEERGALGISDALVRFSAGLESEADLLADVERALMNV